MSSLGFAHGGGDHGGTEIDAYYGGGAAPFDEAGEETCAAGQVKDARIFDERGDGGVDVGLFGDGGG
jgi:hypothetical protein